MVIGLIISSRLGSTRAPSKALLDFFGVPMLGFLLSRVRTSRYVNTFILATSEKPENKILSNLATENQFQYFEGSDGDLTDRYLSAASTFKIDLLVRVTGDCPFVNAELVDFVVCKSIDAFKNGLVDVTTTKGFFPSGLDVECFSRTALERLKSQYDITTEEREHLTLGFYNRDKDFVTIPIHPINIAEGAAFYTVDTMDDYTRVRKNQSIIMEIDSLIRSLIKKNNME
ncbi:hypothetical protein N8932_00620 [Alphaproteobacteria bacterium]|jgi:spore coat polysaccharide biosynthesis protein SpsF (cytidylyltransferase family)|nr:hypothetical protein [Alphaproteobacteria bacterium]